MKKLNLLIVALLALSLILAACQPAPTEVVEETEEVAVEQTEEIAVEETEEVAVEETEEVAVEETEEVAEEPAETEGPAPAAEDKWCSGTNIVFFPGGSPGGPFATVVYNGAEAAAADLGANMETVWSEWNPEKMVTQFAEAVATQPDGIAIMGHPGDDAFEPLVDDAEAQGIIVTSSNTQLPLLQAPSRSAPAARPTGWRLRPQSRRRRCRPRSTGRRNTRRPSSSQARCRPRARRLSNSCRPRLWRSLAGSGKPA